MSRYSLRLSFLITLCGAIVLSAQEPRPRVSELVEVTVANVEVIVTDAQGNRVKGLRRDAFELLENGKPVRVSNFAEVAEDIITVESAPPLPGVSKAPAAAPTPAAAPVRRVVVFIDLGTVRGIRRHDAVKSIGEFLDQLGPQDERVIASWDDTGLKIEVPPEADRETERAKLKELARRAPAKAIRSGVAGASFRQHMVTQRKNRLLRSVLAVRALLTQMKPLDGRKVLVMVTAGFPLRPGKEIMMTPNFDEDTRAVKLYDSFAIEARRLLDSLGDAANAAGVTLYTIHGLGAAPRVAIGSYRVPDGGGSGPPTNMILPGIGVDPVYVENSVSGLTVLAEKSGGVVTAKTDDLASAFRGIREDLGSYYSLGYRLSGPLDAEREVEVRMREPGLTARARTSVVVHSAGTAAEDALVTNLALPQSPWGATGIVNDLGITAVAQPAARSARGSRRLAVEVRIPLAPLSWEEDGDALTATVALFIGAADAEKTLTDVEEFEQTIRGSRAEIERKGAYYTYVFDVDLRTRTAENDLAVAVVDNGSGMTGHAVIHLGARGK